MRLGRLAHWLVSSPSGTSQQKAHHQTCRNVDALDSHAILLVNYR